ncbi:MAG: hypothetical protein SFW07_04425 [Gammaproteobacteria bacterium]|nr:hypothetical protein [Gammaproteobacteria bacterium]
MQQSDAFAPTEKDQITSLKAMIQEFIVQHEHGKGQPRKDAITSLREFAKTEFDTPAAAYAKIFEIIDQETTKAHKKTPKIVNLLKALHKQITLQKESIEKQKAADEKLKAEETKRQAAEQAKKETEETLSKTLANRSKSKKASVVQTEPPKSTEKEKLLQAEAAKLREELEAEKRSKEEAAQKAEKRLAREKRKAEKALKAQQTAEELARKAAEELKAKEIALQSKVPEAAKLLDQVEEQRRLREEALNSAAEEKRLRKHAENLVTQANEQRVKTLQETEEELAKMRAENLKKYEELRKAEEEKLKAVREATERGVQETQKAYANGRNEGIEEGKELGHQEIVLYVQEVAKRHPEVKKAFQHVRRLEGSQIQKKHPGALLLKQFGEDTADDSTARDTRKPQFNHTDRSYSDEPIRVFNDKASCLAHLVATRAALIGKACDSTEEKRQLAITLAAIEYFICNLKLREHDKPMRLIQLDACNFMASMGIECYAISSLVFDDSEELSSTALSEKQGETLIKLLGTNPFGFNPHEAIKVFQSYINDKDLAKAEKRLRQTFIRAIEEHMIETWLGTKYAVVKALVSLYKKLSDNKTAENIATMQHIKLSVFLLVVHKDNKTVSALFEDIKKLTSSEITEFLGTIQSHITSDEKISGKDLSSVEFDVFTALFQKAKFFIFSDVNVYNYFNGEGKQLSESACIQELLKTQPPTKQQAPRGPSAFHTEAKVISGKDKATTGQPLMTSSANIVGATK